MLVKFVLKLSAPDLYYYGACKLFKLFYTQIKYFYSVFLYICIKNRIETCFFLVLVFFPNLRGHK